jgi:putative ABC transport system permease protein
MPSVLHDLRFAHRILVKSPVFTAVVVITLALSIGLNTAVFSAIDALILRPLPGVRAPSELVQLYRSWPGDFKYGSNSVPHYLDVRERSGDVFSGVALWSFAQLSIAADGRTQRLMGAMVSANYFSMLGVSAEKGRVFLPEEDQGRGAHPVAVVSHNAWQETFGGDPLIVGKQVVLNGQNYSIIGVVPQEFKGIISIVTPALFVPLMQFDHLRPGNQSDFERRGNNSHNVIARLKPGVSYAAANERMKALVAQLRAEHPDDYKDSGITVVRQSDAGIHPTMRPAQVGLSSVVMAVVMVLLLVSCVNVANLIPRPRARPRPRNGHSTEPRRAPRRAHQAAAHRKPGLRRSRGCRGAARGPMGHHPRQPDHPAVRHRFQRRIAPEPDRARLHHGNLGGDDADLRAGAGTAGHQPVAHCRAQGRGPRR